jgi:PTH1 family peptidyl-tRNA hydrolase
MKTKNEDILFIGLGNFSEQYIYTRHNIGSDFLLYLYNRKSFEESKLFLHINDTIGNKFCLFLIPKLYMNVSGEIFRDTYLKKIIRENKTKIIIIHDDLELSFGEFKLRNNKERGERGHNGNRSVNKVLKEIQGLQYQIPYYLSIGIGRPDDGLVDKWVLKKFSLKEICDLEDIIYPKIKKELVKISENPLL